MIPISIVNGKYFIFDIDSVKRVRNDHLIIGTLSGTLSILPQQNILLGLPLQLTSEEALWLTEMGLGYLIFNLKSSGLNLEPKVAGDETRLNTVESSDSDRKLEIYQSESVQSELSADLRKIKDSVGYQTFKFFKSFQNGSRYAVLPGMRFGGKYLVYNGDPLRYHAQFIVQPLDYKKDDIGMINIVNNGRLSTGVKKLWVVAGEKEDGSTECFSVEWAGFG
ncbi:unnamed protein product [Kuraishia capsulata CBS 1993]|uniref:tRNA-intron lyase n=1 Tax=Kuraishia capsulata CBS 1993 TaxID=1382522 RepID=W6MW07_9ASCO|nr:uncharacterized protein KUCA_T00002709001 [Kuraishia capsulata CBS 1993]CDK26735.1 unnamed protein product [Kuraishia capsulata CBS 1993]